MRVFRGALVLALLAGAGTAYAQEKPIPKYGEQPNDKTPQEKAAEKAAEQAYKRSLGNIPDQGPTDPWGAVRGNSDAPKASTTKASAAKAKKTKTASARSRVT